MTVIAEARMAPACVSAPPAVTLNVLALTVPSSSGPCACSVTLPPLADTAPANWLAAPFNVMSPAAPPALALLAAAENAALPPALMVAPFCTMPVATSAPDALTVASAPVVLIVIGPAMLFACPRLTALLPAPFAVTLNPEARLCTLRLSPALVVMLPAPLPRSMLARSTTPTCFTCTTPAPALLSEPPMALPAAGAVKVPPETTKLRPISRWVPPGWVMLPVPAAVVSVKSLPTWTLPSCVAAAPELFSVTSPAACVVSTDRPPPTVSAPLCVTWPPAMIPRSPVMLDVPRTMALASRSKTFLPD